MTSPFRMDPTAQATLLNQFDTTAGELTTADSEVYDNALGMKAALWGDAMNRLGPGVDELHGTFNGIIKIFNELGTGVLHATRFAQQAEDANNDQVLYFMADINGGSG